MKNNIIYRKVQPADAQEFVNFHNLVWRDAYENIFPEEVFIDREKRSAEKVGNFSQKFLNNGNQINYVAVFNNKIIGLMGGYQNSQNVYFNGFADLAYLYVHPDFQHKGIGTKLRDIFINWAKMNKANKFVIGVLEENYKARRVYERWGGKLDKHIEQINRLGKYYKEVFYTFDI